MMRKEKFHPFDEEFAAAADDFFDGNIVRTDREDTELSMLLDTLERVDDAFSDAAAIEAHQRIRKNLHKAWFEIESEKATQRPGVLAQFRAFFWRYQPQTRLAASFAMILLILVAVPSFFGSKPQVMGTAGTWLSSPIIMTIVLVGLVATLFWILRPPKR